MWASETVCVQTLCVTDGWWVEFSSHYLSIQCVSGDFIKGSRGWGVDREDKGYTWDFE